MIIQSQRAKATRSTGFSRSQIHEVQRCVTDPSYFIQTYLTIPVNGKFEQIKNRQYQTDFICAAGDSTSVIQLAPRQSGSTIIPLALMFWQLMFKPGVQLAAMFGTVSDANNSMDLIHHWYFETPTWLRDDCIRRTSRLLELDSGSMITVDTANVNFMRGRALSRLFIDSMGHLPNIIQTDVWTSAVPSILSGTSVLLTGTPTSSGTKFAEIWIAATAQKIPIEALRVQASDVYDPVSLMMMSALMDATTYAREIECQFTP